MCRNAKLFAAVCTNLEDAYAPFSALCTSYLFGIRAHPNLIGSPVCIGTMPA